MAGPADVVPARGRGCSTRFPGLRFGVTEGGCWWLPGLLWSWDRLCLGARGAAKLGKDTFAEALGDMLPSEYVDRNCFTGLANAKRRELGMRYEIGIDNMLWGTDFPHPEGTWPNTQRLAGEDVLRHPDRRDPPHARPRRRRRPSASTWRRCAPLAEKIGPTPTDLGQLTPTQTAADLEARWARVKAVGRHWLTGHDFPLLPGAPN